MCNKICYKQYNIYLYELHLGYFCKLRLELYRITETAVIEVQLLHISNKSIIILFRK